MALTNPKLFGLNVRTLLADVKNKNTAIQNLGLNPLDLEVIKGSSNAGMSRFDWISFSRLKNPLYKTLDRFNNESTTFNEILLKRAGTDQTLFGNLDINGSISGSAIRYRFLKDGDPGKIADISTSRVSAWSSADPRANDPNLSIQKLAKISYGARVGIVEDGKLEFGSQSSGVSGERLQTTIVPEKKEFDSEVPTSRIKCKIGTETVFLYAMKGIPLVFKGFFRNVNATATVQLGGDKKNASWKIVETANNNLFTNYPNQGTEISSISYRSPISKERFIKLYKNPDEITSIQIQSANLRELPATQLKECTSLDFGYNQLKLFPNFRFIAPKLSSLFLMRNPFYLSDVETERTFNEEIINKIPKSIVTLNIEGTFYGSIKRGLIPDGLKDGSTLSKLSNFSCARGGGAYFHEDTRPATDKIAGATDTNNEGSESFCPDMPASCTTYNISVNDFRSVDLEDNGSITGILDSYSFKKLPNLVNLYVNSNYHLDDIVGGTGQLTFLTSADNNTIVEIDYGVTNLNIPGNLGGCFSLKTYRHAHARGARDQLVTGTTYAFNSCTSLEILIFYHTNLGKINFPEKFTNPVLRYLDLRYTSIKGGKAGKSDADQEHVIYAETFEDATELVDLYIDSPNLGVGFPSDKNTIHSDAFLFNPKLYYFWYRSYGATTGEITSLFNSNPQLQYLWLQQNNFTGILPSFTVNTNIHYVNLQFNAFSGSIPGYQNLNNLRYLYLQNNQLTGMKEPGLLPKLETYQAFNNQITGQIPDLSGILNVRSIDLSNNQFTSYKVGSFTKLYKVNFINLKFNNLTQTDMDNILIDLHTNWESIKRGGVSINLKEQTVNDSDASNNGAKVFPTEAGFSKARILEANGWTIGIDGGIPDEPAF